MQASSVIWHQCSIWCASPLSGCHSTSEEMAVLPPSLSCSVSCLSARRPALCESLHKLLGSVADLSSVGSVHIQTEAAAYR